jgi:hypothetical protein
MKTKTIVLTTLLLLAAFAVAGEKAEAVKLTGSLACAKCMLGEQDACQSVLVVDGVEGKDPAYYYIVENEVADEFGHPCQEAIGAVVTGTIEDKDGKVWLTPTKMESPEKS